MEACLASFLPGRQTTVHWLGDANEEEKRTAHATRSSRSAGVVVEQQQRQRILLEVVGALGLESNKRQSETTTTTTTTAATATVSPYCKIQLYDDNNNLKVLHRTATIRNDANPIWTAKTKSLCIVSVPADAASSTTSDSSSSSQAPPVSLEARTTRSNEAGEESTTTAVATTDESSSDKENDEKRLLIRTSVVIDVCHGRSTILGRVFIPFDKLLQEYCCNEERRIEFPIVAVTTTTTSSRSIPQCAVLACRFRRATDSDAVFLQKLYQDPSSVRRRDLGSNNSASTSAVASASELLQEDEARARQKERRHQVVAADINFQSVKTKSFFQRTTKIDPKNGQQKTLLRRVWPYPDPQRPVHETEWMTSDDIERTAYGPSTNWVTAGPSSETAIGKLYIEIIGCHHLPQMDIGAPGDLTDAFCVLALEDSLLRTDVIWDNLNPRWMPWTTRSFVFGVRHPASLLYLSVLDYDETTPLDRHHDPIGRVVLRLNDFQANNNGTTYTLHYALQHDPREGPPPSLDDGSASSTPPPRGTITLRLRIEWQDENAAMKLFLTPPPRFIINVDNDASYQTLRYTTRGAIDMEKASVDSIKIYTKEIMSYGTHVCFVLDVLLETLLWRGRFQITKNKTVWFPIHSMALLGATAFLVEHPGCAVSIVLYAIAWILITMNYHAHRRPYPWKRVQSCMRFNLILIFGQMSLFSSAFSDDGSQEIAANQGVEEEKVLAKLDEIKAARMLALIQAFLRYKRKVSSMYRKTEDTSVKITTEVRSWSLTGSLVSRLSPVHSLLGMICSYLRLGRNFVSWRSGYTSVFTNRCILLATIWLLLPMNSILLWTARVMTWALLGPWMKWIDIRYFRPWYATKQELLNRIRSGTLDDVHEIDLPDLDSVLESEKFYKVIKAGRMKNEELIKLRDMRSLLFGSYSVAIPFTENSRYPNIPLPQSTAVRTAPPNEDDDDNGTPVPRGYHVPGQMLSRDRMIPDRESAAAFLMNDRRGGDGAIEAAKKTN